MRNIVEKPFASKMNFVLLNGLVLVALGRMFQNSSKMLSSGVSDQIYMIFVMSSIAIVASSLFIFLLKDLRKFFQSYFVTCGILVLLSAIVFFVGSFSGSFNSLLGFAFGILIFPWIGLISSFVFNKYVFKNMFVKMYLSKG